MLSLDFENWLFARCHVEKCCKNCKIFPNNKCSNDAWFCQPVVLVFARCFFSPLVNIVLIRIYLDTLFDATLKFSLGAFSIVFFTLRVCFFRVSNTNYWITLCFYCLGLNEATFVVLFDALWPWCFVVKTFECFTIDALERLIWAQLQAAHPLCVDGAMRCDERRLEHASWTVDLIADAIMWFQFKSAPAPHTANN